MNIKYCLLHLTPEKNVLKCIFFNVKKMLIRAHILKGSLLFYGFLGTLQQNGFLHVGYTMVTLITWPDVFPPNILI